MSSKRFDTAHATQEAPRVKQAGVTEHQAREISRILVSEYESNPVFRDVVDSIAAIRGVLGASPNPTSAGSVLLPPQAGASTPKGAPATSLVVAA